MPPKQQMSTAILEAGLSGIPFTVLGSEDAINRQTDYRIECMVAKFRTWNTLQYGDQS